MGEFMRVISLAEVVVVVMVMAGIWIIMFVTR